MDRLGTVVLQILFDCNYTHPSFRQGLPESSCHGWWHGVAPAFTIRGTGFPPIRGENDGWAE